MSISSQDIQVMKQTLGIKGEPQKNFVEIYDQFQKKTQVAQSSHPQAQQSMQVSEDLLGFQSSSPIQVSNSVNLGQKPSYELRHNQNFRSFISTSSFQKEQPPSTTQPPGTNSNIQLDLLDLDFLSNTNKDRSQIVTNPPAQPGNTTQTNAKMSNSGGKSCDLMSFDNSSNQKANKENGAQHNPPITTSKFMTPEQSAKQSGDKGQSTQF